MSKIIYTLTDEAPALATYSLLPIIEAFTAAAGIDVETRDISLAGRIAAEFSDFLEPDQRTPDALAELGEMISHSDANIIKLPNISASTPQLKAAIAELQAAGYAVPDYPDEGDAGATGSGTTGTGTADNAGETDGAGAIGGTGTASNAGTASNSSDLAKIRERYNQVKGSAVNPVLRGGNSDRRAPAAVKQYARRFPHPMGTWSPDSKTHVATMSAGDFRSNEKSVALAKDCTLEICFVADGATTTMNTITATAGTVVDATFMSVAALNDFLTDQLRDAKQSGVLFSLHLKATMMKVSDPIIFGHCVRAFFASVFEKHGDVLDAAGANPNNGLANVLAAVDALPDDQRRTIAADIEDALAQGPALAMVDSDNAITNLHVPSDVIVDASMPAMIRMSGQMWNRDGEQQDTKAVIPDSSYAAVFQTVIDDCKAHGAYDPTSIGTVPNVGLMAYKAEEYGSHDKTYEVLTAGTMEVRVASRAHGDTDRDVHGDTHDGEVLLQHKVAAGDIWRMCTTNDIAIENWVALAAQRGRATGSPVVFWLDKTRAHDAQLIARVERYLDDGSAGHTASGSIGDTASSGFVGDTDALTIEVLAPADACAYSLARMRRGEDTISVTGNVLRDYNTDLFPILELGTSAKMLSIVPLMAGGGLFETGAGGSAPKHVAQFVAENHLRWDSLGEFLALVVSLEHLAVHSDNPAAQLLSETLSEAVGKWLEEGRSPSRKVNEPDNRASHYYLAKHWAAELAAQGVDAALAARFAPLADALADGEGRIVTEMVACQGVPVELGGYYWPDPELIAAAMRPSATFNAVLADFAAGKAAA